MPLSPNYLTSPRRLETCKFPPTCSNKGQYGLNAISPYKIKGFHDTNLTPRGLLQQNGIMSRHTTCLSLPPLKC